MARKPKELKPRLGMTMVETLALIDSDIKQLLPTLNEDQIKCLYKDYFIINRWLSSVRSFKREILEHYVLATNQYYNRNWAIISKHPELQWLALCTCSHGSKQPFEHNWIGLKKKSGSSKVMKFLEEIYPTRKLKELELMSKLSTEDDFIELAITHGYTDSQIKKIFNDK
jgi:hypothetical protein